MVGVDMTLILVTLPMSFWTWVHVLLCLIHEDMLGGLVEVTSTTIASPVYVAQSVIPLIAI